VDRGTSGVERKLERKKEIIKGKTARKGTREEKIKDGSPNKRQHSKMKNAQWGALRQETK
jgi:hypothetical protein